MRISRPLSRSTQRGLGQVNNFGKNLALWLVIGLLLIALFNLFQGSTSRNAPTTLAYSDFLAEVGQIEPPGAQISIAAPSSASMTAFTSTRGSAGT